MRIVHSINRILAESSGWLVTVIMVLLLSDIAARLFFKPLQGVSELAVFALVATVYLGLSHCEERHGHVRVEILLTRLSERWRRRLSLCTRTLSTMVLAILVYSAAQSARTAWSTGEAVAGTVPLPVAPVKTVILAGLVLYLVQTALGSQSNRSGEGEGE
ncbi:MAG: TRAP transporter small permease [Synergistales bacterium]|nr:TRAP transporter small permease [Synergistales bacterium]